MKKVRKHRFVESHPVLASVLACVFLFIFCQMIQSYVDMACSKLIKGYDYQSGPVGLIVAVPIVFLLYKWWFRPEFEGMLKGNLLLGFKLMLIEVIYVLVGDTLAAVVENSIHFRPLTMLIIVSSFTAGIVEEFVFRGVIISTLMRQWKDLGKFRTAALVSGLAFGLVHAMNIFVGANPLRTLIQVIGSVGFGMLFAAVYLRCGSLIPPMFFHTLHDIIAIACSPEVTDNGTITEMSNFGLVEVVTLAMEIGLGAIAWWLLRPEKHAELKAIWNRKWNVPVTPAEITSAEESVSDIE